MSVKCPECGAGADKTPDGSYAHCASCNTVFEPDKVGSSEKGTAHPDYEKPKKDEKKDEKDEAKSQVEQGESKKEGVERRGSPAG